MSASLKTGTTDHPPSASRRTRLTQRERTANALRRLLDAAIELFAAQGYERTTTEQIAERAGYSRSMVNARYGSKEGLLEAMLATEWESHLVAAASRPGTGLARILGVVDIVTDLARHDLTRLRAFMVVGFEAAGPMTGLRPHVQERLRRIHQAFADAIEAGTVDGTIRPDVVPEEEAWEILHAGIGATYHWIIDSDAFDIPAHLARWRKRIEQRLRASTDDGAGAG